MKTGCRSYPPLRQRAYCTALSFDKRLEKADSVPSVRRVGPALDNVISESFVSTPKCELIHRRYFPTRQDARSAVFEHLEAFYNRRQSHSLLGHRRPESYKELGTKEVAVAQQKIATKPS